MGAYNCVQDLLFGEVYRFGYLNFPELIPGLRRVYDDLVRLGISVDVRMEVLQHVAGLVRNAPSVSIGAFLPFICQDPDRGVVATASVEYVSLGPLVDNDLMSRPKELIDFIQPQFAKWWLPDAVEFANEIPRTSAGKFKKTALREIYGDYYVRARV